MNQVWSVQWAFNIDDSQLATAVSCFIFVLFVVVVVVFKLRGQFCGYGFRDRRIKPLTPSPVVPMSGIVTSGVDGILLNGCSNCHSLQNWGQ